MLACGLAAKPLSCRVAALDATTATADDEHERVSHTGHWAGRLVAVQALKLGRLADAIEELIPRSPMLARVFALRLLALAAND